MNFTRVFFYLFLIAVVIMGFVFFRWVFDYLLFATVFSYILSPAVSWLERKHIPRWLAVVCVYFSIALVITWFIYRYIPTLVEEGNNLLDLIQSDGASIEYFLTMPIIKSLHDFLASLDRQVPNMNLASSLVEFLEMAKNFLVALPKLIVDNYQLILNTLSYFFMIPLIGFFLLKDGNHLIKDIFKIVPNRYFELCIIIVNKVNEVVGNFLRAMIFEVISVTIMASVALSIVGVKNAVLIGMIAGVANIIPYFGPFIGTMVAIISILIDGNTSLMPIVNIIIAMYVVQMIDNNVVYPVVVGTTINMHPLIVLLTVLAGGLYGGIIWMLISVPLVYLVYNIAKVLVVNLKKFHLI